MENLFRSLLFVPGNQAAKIEKAWQVGADCVVLDLEDGVPPSQKTAARDIVRLELDVSPPTSSAILVRINSTSPERYEDVEAAIHSAVDGIMLPKCCSAKDVGEIAEEMGRIEQRKGIADRKVKLFLMVESARGVLELPSLAAANDRVVAIAFGAEDWCLDMGIVRTKAANEIEFARWNVAVCARAFGLLAIDTVYADFHDLDGLLKDTDTARRIGFSGKLAIHPKQLGPIHSVFAPGAAEIAEAEQVVAAFEEAEAQGRGAAAVNGRMVDRPVAERARRILLLARSIK